MHAATFAATGRPPVGARREASARAAPTHLRGAVIGFGRRCEAWRCRVTPGSPCCPPIAPLPPMADPLPSPPPPRQAGAFEPHLERLLAEFESGYGPGSALPPPGDTGHPFEDPGDVTDLGPPGEEDDGGVDDHRAGGEDGDCGDSGRGAAAAAATSATTAGVKRARHGSAAEAPPAPRPAPAPPAWLPPPVWARGPGEAVLPPMAPGPPFAGPPGGPPPWPPTRPGPVGNPEGVFGLGPGPAPGPGSAPHPTATLGGGPLGGGDPGTPSAGQRKSERERKRREKIAERFGQLASLLDPGGGARGSPNEPRADKLSILAGAIRLINHLRGQVYQLQELSKYLQQRASSQEGRRSYQYHLAAQRSGALAGARGWAGAGVGEGAGAAGAGGAGAGAGSVAGPSTEPGRRLDDNGEEGWDPALRPPAA